MQHIARPQGRILWLIRFIVKNAAPTIQVFQHSQAVHAKKAVNTNCMKGLYNQSITAKNAVLTIQVFQHS